MKSKQIISNLKDTDEIFLSITESGIWMYKYSKLSNLTLTYTNGNLVKYFKLILTRSLYWL